MNFIGKSFLPPTMLTTRKVHFDSTIISYYTLISLDPYAD